MFSTDVASLDEILHEYYVGNEDMPFLLVLYINKLHKGLRSSAFKPIMGLRGNVKEREAPEHRDFINSSSIITVIPQDT